MRVLFCITALLTLPACAGQATLLPQGDHGLKVIAQGPTVDSARRAAESEAIKACRKSQKVYDLTSESTAVLDSADGKSEYRVIWRFNCVERDY